MARLLQSRKNARYFVLSGIKVDIILTSRQQTEGLSVVSPRGCGNL